MPGQTFRIQYMPHTQLGDREFELGLRATSTLLSEGGARKLRPDKDASHKVVHARTSVHVGLNMPPFAGRVTRIPLGPHGEHAYWLRNYDGAHGAHLAARLESAFGLDVLDPPSGKGTGAKCAAAQGNNCQDTYTKLFPLRMFLEHRLDLLEQLLRSSIDAVNAHSPVASSAANDVLSIHRGDTGAPAVGEAQILRFLSGGGGGGGGGGSRMHVHVDKPGTRWVAIMALGDQSSFVLDYAPQCRRCWTGGGKGTAGHKWSDWHKLPCPTCHEVRLASGDCLLFYGDPTAGVAHGTLGTHRHTAPDTLPSWCKGGRVSCQYRQTEIRQNYAECGAYD